MNTDELLEQYKEGERDFSGITIKNARLERVILSEINLSHANLYGANFFKAQIKDSDLRGITLSRANMRAINLKGVDFSEARLYGTDFRNATLEKILFVHTNLRQANFAGSDIYDSDFRGADLREVNGLVIDSRKTHKDVIEDDFRCNYCKVMVSARAPGTAHRNHCPTCGYSRHVDERKGFRNSECQSLMEPVGLSWKGGGELALVHHCLGCDAIDYNRIAGDDNPIMLLGVYEQSRILEPRTVRLLAIEGISLIGPEEEYTIRSQLFGKPHPDDAEKSG